MATCECGNKFSDKRFALGYRTCLECGEEEAKELSEQRKEQVAPAYNKGAYQYITSLGMARDLGRK